MSEDRDWVRHYATGDRGYLVRDESDVLVVQMDRGDQVLQKRYVENDWPPDVEHHPLTDHQLGKISYDADAGICEIIGEGRKKEWISLRPMARIKWMRDGPLEPEDGPDKNFGVRRLLHRAIHDALEPLTR